MADLERRRRARRRKGLDETASLERDASAARLAALLEDEHPGPEAVALMKELKRDIRRAAKGLTPEQREVVGMVMQGLKLPQIVSVLGPQSGAHWRTAAAHVRRVLAGAPHRRRKPK